MVDEVRRLGRWLIFMDDNIIGDRDYAKGVMSYGGVLSNAAAIEVSVPLVIFAIYDIVDTKSSVRAHNRAVGGSRLNVVPPPGGRLGLGAALAF